jgi:conjugative transfer pilus assembly protein TraH
LKARIFLIVIVFAIIFTEITLVLPVKSYAGFVDDWITQKMETDASYFEGQKRGYFTGGSFSARWPTHSDYLLSFEPPRVKSGCGGIDAYMGGFSFLNFEYLVAKLQRIMTAAPAAAFDMALNTLCPVCSNTIKSLEEIANSLNSLQLDDCKAGSVIAAKLLSNVTDDPKIRQEAEKSFTLTKGIQDLAYKLNETWTADNNQPTQTTVEMTSECPAEIKRLFVTPNQTVLEKIAEGTTITTDGLALIRGFYGDMVLAVKPDGKEGYDLIPPCDQDKFSIDRLYAGEVYKKNVTGGVDQGCVLIDDTNRNLFQWVFNKVQSIGNKMTQKSDLTNEERSFVNNLPTPVYSALRMAVTTNQLGSTITSIADIAARAYTTKIFSDMANLAYNYTYKGKDALAKQGQSPTPGCQTDLLEAPEEFLDGIKKDISNHVKFLKDDYVRALNENGVINEVARRYEQYDKIAREKLATAFSPALAKRVLGAK